jgi:protein involved in polysaccharide export with SLBB domain
MAALITSSLLPLSGTWAQTNDDAAAGMGASSGTSTGPIRLRSTAPASTRNSDARNRDADDYNDQRGSTETFQSRRQDGRQTYIPGEFERFVQRLTTGTQGTQGNTDGADPTLTTPVRRFGSELITGAQASAADYVSQVPPDYLISPGDEIQLTLWGSVDGDLRLLVDRTGRINVPRVGSIMVSGVRYADLPAVITRQVGQVFKNFQLSASLGQLRSIRIYVTGFTARPGSYTVSSLSTIVNALMRAGGPSAAGSFRNIELRRNGKLVSTFDFYDLLIRGDKSADRVLQAEDVIHINSVGPQVALIGSVNKPAIFELKPGETVASVLAMAGGFTAVADKSRLSIERLSTRDDVRITQLALPGDATQTPTNGDVLRAFSAVEATLPIQRQNKRVRVEGEVARPGEFILPAGSTVSDALRAAGGLTPSAFIFGTELNRESVRVTQQENYDRALRDLETNMTRTYSTRRTVTADDAAAQAAQSSASNRLVERLRAVKPTGRIVLNVRPDAALLPDLTLEEGDRLYIPSRPTTVGVFGSVFNGGSYLFGADRSIDDYLQLAGGPTAGADRKSVFVVRANGTVLSSRQRGSGWFGMGANLDGLSAEPGDTIFVPEELDKTTFIQEAKDWTQILYQFGLGAAALKTIRSN